LWLQGCVFDILFHRVRKKDGSLEHDGDTAAQFVAFYVTDVDAVYQNIAGFYAVKAHQKICYCSLAAAG
jgi:hypothetical protein